MITSARIFGWDKKSLDITLKESSKRYLQSLEGPQTLPIEGYEEEVILASDLDGAKQQLHKQFMSQPWVQAVFEQRQYDFENSVPILGRTYEVMWVHLAQLREHHSSVTRFLGFDLIEVSEDKYLSNHFEFGERITFLSNRNFHLRALEKAI